MKNILNKLMGNVGTFPLKYWHIVLGLIAIIFLFTSSTAKKFDNPIDVGWHFSYFLMTDDNRAIGDLKSYSDPSIHSKIEETIAGNEIAPENINTIINDYNFYLSGYRRVADNVVATYTIPVGKRDWHTTVVLSPTNPSDVISKIRSFIYFYIPFGNKITSLNHENKWLVTNYFGENIKEDELIKALDDDTALDTAILDKDVDQIIKEYEDMRIKEEGFRRLLIDEEIGGMKSLFERYKSYIYDESSADSSVQSICPYLVDSNFPREYFSNVFNEVMVTYSPKLVNSSEKTLPLKERFDPTKPPYGEELYVVPPNDAWTESKFDVDNDQIDERILSANTAMNHTPNLAVIVKNGFIIFKVQGANIDISEVGNHNGFFLSEAVDWNAGEYRTIRYIYKDEKFTPVWYQTSCAVRPQSD